MLRHQLVRVVRAPDRISSSAVLAATVGSFDGFHRGHAALVAAVRQERDHLRASGLQAYAAVVSFYPHPAVVLGRAPERNGLMVLRQKLEFLAEQGIDFLVLLRFSTGLAALSAEEFLSGWLIRRYRVQHLVIGPDAALGAEREAGAAGIKEIFESLGGSCKILPALEQDGVKISSRRIRTLIEEGRVAEARLLLGRPFALCGRVVSGERRGRGMGFPTINLAAGQLLPASGVYAAKLDLEGTEYSAVTNIGMRPTFGGRSITVESHILDYAGGELYGATLSLALYERLRDELRFESSEALQRQIGRDIEHCRAYFAQGGDVA